jgi:hypothetical protein
MNILDNVRGIGVGIVLVLCLPALAGGATPSNSTVEELLSTRLETAAHPNGGRAGELTDEQLKGADPNRLLDITAQWMQSSDWLAKAGAFRYSVRVAKLHPQPVIRQRVAGALVDEIVRPKDEMRDRCLDLLVRGFVAADFSHEAKSRLCQALQKERPGQALILTCGIADVTAARPRLRELVIDERKFDEKSRSRYGSGSLWYLTPGWRARLALARMGEPSDIAKCVEVVSSSPGKGVGPITTLNDMGYIRQPAAIDFLKTLVDSNDTMGEITPGIPEEPVASYVIDVLADCLEGFPVQRREGRRYRDHEIELVRKWMAAQTTWRIIR